MEAVLGQDSGAIPSFRNGATGPMLAPSGLMMAIDKRLQPVVGSHRRRKTKAILTYTGSLALAPRSARTRCQFPQDSYLPKAIKVVWRSAPFSDDNPGRRTHLSGGTRLTPFCSRLETTETHYRKRAIV